MLRPYIVSRVRSSLIIFFLFFSFSLSLSLFLSFFFFLSSPINHLYSCARIPLSHSRKHLYPSHIHILSITLSLFLFLSVIRSLSLGKIIPILRYTLEKYAMPKIGWRPEGNHSDITDNRCVYVSVLRMCHVYVCVRVFFYTRFWFLSSAFLKMRQKEIEYRFIDDGSWYKIRCTYCLCGHKVVL